jgi:hypothetical protein
MLFVLLHPISQTIVPLDAIEKYLMNMGSIEVVSQCLDLPCKNYLFWNIFITEKSQKSKLKIIGKLKHALDR